MLPVKAGLLFTLFPCCLFSAFQISFEPFWELSEDELAKKQHLFISKLPQVNGDSLEEALSHFFDQRLSPTPISSVPGLETASRSGDRVFFLKDTEGKVQKVVKACPKNQSPPHFHTLKEASALSFFQKLNLETASAPKVLKLGESQGYTLLGIPYYPHPNLVQMIRSFKRGEQKDFMPLEKASFAVGRFLGELRKKSPKIQAPPPRHLEKERAAILAEIEKPVHNLNAKRLRDVINFAFADYSKEPFQFLYSRGDSNLRNYLYDPNNDRLIVLDLGGLHDSIGKEGLPFGGQFERSFFRFYDRLYLKGFSSLNREEAEKLREAFIKGYASQAPLPSKNGFLVGELRYFLRRLKIIYSSRDSLDERKRQKKESLYRDALDFFKRLEAPS